MKIEDFKQMTVDILENITDQAKISELLTTLVDDYTKIDNKINSLTTENVNFKTDNEKLRTANMNLFLKIGEKVDTPTPEKSTIESKEPLNKPREFKDLFNEKGGLK